MERLQFSSDSEYLNGRPSLDSRPYPYQNQISLAALTLLSYLLIERYDLFELKSRNLDLIVKQLPQHLRNLTFLFRVVLAKN